MGAPMSLFSIVVPVHNRPELVRQTLDSLRAQTLEDWTAIVVDDGSTDDTPAVLARHAAEDARITVVRQPNAGASAARNAGIARATGAWLAFLDSDDWYEPGALAAWRRAIEQEPACGVVVGLLAHDPRTHPDHAEGRVVARDAFLAALGFTLEWPQILLQATAVRRDALEAAGGGFDPSYETSEDRELLIRATAASPVAFVHTVVAGYRMAYGGGKSERYLASGGKLAAHRRIFGALPELPVVRRRLAGDPEGAERLARQLPAYLRMLDAAQHLRDGEVERAVRALEEALDAWAPHGDPMVLARRLAYLSYYPASRKIEACARCAVWARAAAPLVDRARYPAIGALLDAVLSWRGAGGAQGA
jgi:hypothetical protein